MSIPASFAGLATTVFGFIPTAIVYIAVIAVLALINTVTAFTRHAKR